MNPLLDLSLLLILSSESERLHMPLVMALQKKSNVDSQTKRKPGRKRRNYIAATKGVPLDPNIINSKLVPKNIEAFTKESYDRQLQNWDDL